MRAGAAWEYEDDGGVWRTMVSADSERLETLWADDLGSPQSFERRTRRGSRVRYRLDFDAMEQINEGTSRRRKIRRRGSTPPAAAAGTSLSARGVAEISIAAAAAEEPPSSCSLPSWMSPTFELEDVTAAFLPAMAGLFAGTVTPRLSVGNDQRVGSGAYDRLEVSSVHRVHSAAAWMAYAASKEALRRDAVVADDLGVPPPPPHRPLTLGHLSAEMVGSLDADVGEAFLMHGTKRGAQRHIARVGFDERLSGTGSGTFYGQGVYFAENVCKADQYSTPDGGASAA